jgi:hypothetical protein
VPANDLCSNAAVIDLTPFDQTLSSSTVGTQHDLDAPCVAGGPDVFYTFTLSRPELVYADTLGASFDTILFFASSCTTPLAVSAPATGLIECDDDFSGAGCATGGTASQVTAYLAPGTYYLVLSTKGATGTTPIRFQHLPTGNNGAAAAPYPAPIPLPAGTSTQTGTTGGTGLIRWDSTGIAACFTSAGATALAGASDAPEQSYFWRSCPESAGGNFTATTCNAVFFDSVLYVATAGAGGDCDDDNSACAASTLTSILPHPTATSLVIPAGASLHTFTVDGYDIATGTFILTVNRP